MTCASGWTVYLDNDNTVLLAGLVDQISGDPENSATVTAWVEDGNGTQIGDAIAMPYVTGSSGDYRGNFNEDFPWPSGRFYIVTKALAGSAVATWRQPYIATYRQ